MEWMVEASRQPRARMTSAALPVKAPKATSPSTPAATCRASVVLPVPAKPNRRNTCGEPRRSHAATAFSAASCCGDQFIPARIASQGLARNPGVREATRSCPRGARLGAQAPENAGDNRQAAQENERVERLAVEPPPDQRDEWNA